MVEKNVLNINLLKEDAIVIHALLSEFVHKKKLNIEDMAEKNALLSFWDVLDQTLSEPFEEDYQDVLKEARNFERNRSFEIRSLE